jgi:hypothetical protein
LLLLRWHILRLVPLAHVAEQLGVDEDALSDYAAGSGIGPRFRVNGRPLYDPADFGGAATLLRPARNPAEHPTLLQPVGQTITSDDKLLRPLRLAGEATADEAAPTREQDRIVDPLPVRSQRPS